ncbi:HEPN domain-containing protein [Acidianus sp. HS-5]|uniref:HEPN domain-containing protein n=1 Tax=Acidianus sp. HS-5 TaxID=2886040 RepID=UPI001F30EDF0|nr:HEPN domain-containing protein [Acidianus sp. HS-5]BDC17549.1 DNA-binding protein [Acidianus sp. HS-5]
MKKTRQAISFNIYPVYDYLCHTKSLIRGAKDYLRASELLFQQRFYEASALNSEVSAQLSLKGLLYKLGVEPPRTHRIRELLSLVYTRLGDERIRDFTRDNREKLIILENIRGKSQYGLPPEDEAEIALIITREILKIVESLWNL